MTKFVWNLLMFSVSLLLLKAIFSLFGKLILWIFLIFVVFPLSMMVVGALIYTLRGGCSNSEFNDDIIDPMDDATDYTVFEKDGKKYVAIKKNGKVIICEHVD